VGPSATVTAGKEYIYYTNGLDFEVEVYDTLGHQVRTLRRSLGRLRMTNAHKEEIIQQLVEVYRSRPDGRALASDFEKILRTSARWSDYKTAWGNVREDAEGNVWLEHYRAIYPHVVRADSRRTTWSVFDTEGRFLGEVAVPGRVMVSSISKDELLGFWHDELDVKHVRVYRLIKPGGKTR
jgi:hypothetical protein